MGISFIIFPLFVIVNISVSQVSCGNHDEEKNDTIKWPTLKPEWSYCYEFTWFGPSYDNITRYNGTCSDYLDDTRAEGVPCVPPIVITYDGSYPDMRYLWDKHRSSILCKRSQGQRCVRFTYYFNNMINNVTYMCSKVKLNDGSIPSDGCFKEKVSEGYQREMCLCKSSKGIYPPCNTSFRNFLSFTSILLYLLLNIMMKYTLGC